MDANSINLSDLRRLRDDGGYIFHKFAESEICPFTHI